MDSITLSVIPQGIFRITKYFHLLGILSGIEIAGKFAFSYFRFILKKKRLQMI